MARDQLVSVSKFLSRVLRHKPDEIGLVLDAQGWADVDDLLRRANAHGVAIDRALLERVVAENDKKRFAFSDDGPGRLSRRIRASQGHSIDVDLGLPPSEPPATLYHGTASRFLESIREKGLIAGKRDHVHLSRDVATATTVGTRHGKAVVLTVAAQRLHQSGEPFYLSANGVWLVRHVPVGFIEFPE